MSRIKIITDSACDIPVEKELELGIHILHFPITVGEMSFRERENYTYDEFYDLLLSSPVLPTTAQITQIEFLELFETYYQQGYTDLIYVSINQKGSNTYASSVMARNAFFEQHPEAAGACQIHLVDSATYTMMYGYAVIQAAEKARRGAEVPEILAFLDDWLTHTRVYALPFDLRFAKKSGRVSATAAFVGDLMGIRPIVSFIDGESVVLSKIRGDKAIIPTLTKMAVETMVPQTPYMILRGNADSEQAAEELKKSMIKATGYGPYGTFQIGAAIAINIGPKLIAVAIKQRDDRL